MKSLKSGLLFALALFLLISAASAVWGDWDPRDPHKMHFPQEPDPEGWDVCVLHQWVADDFMCTKTAPIEDIHFWVSWQRDQIGDIEMLEPDISIWSDGGGQPRERLWTWNREGEVAARAYGTGPQGWVCPSMGEMLPDDHMMYFQINITKIAKPYVQQRGTVYWLVVKVDMPPGGPVVGWKTSKTDPPGPIWNSPALWSMGPDSGIPWQPVETGMAMRQVHDMAFVITGEQHLIPIDRPTFQIGHWLTFEDHHGWIGPDDIIPVQLQAIDPCEQIQMVEFFYSMDPTGPNWEHFYTDEDGTQPLLDRDASSHEENEGDGWSGYLDPAILSQANEPMPMQLMARYYYDVESFFDVFTEITLDPSPPDSVELNVQDWDVVEGEELIVDVDPNPRYPYDIQYIIVDLEFKPVEFAKGIPTVDQLKAGRQYGGGQHCAPTATAACLKYFEGEGDGDICGGLSADDLTDALAGYQGTNNGQKGTTWSGWVNGIKNWIDDNGGGYTVRSGSFNWKTARDELERCQDVLLRIGWPGDGGHAVTFNSIVNTPQSDGTIRIDVMDPYGGKIGYGDLNPNTGWLDNFDGPSGNQGTLTHMIIICPEEDGPGGPGVQEPGPDPDPIPIPIPDPGYYFVRVTVVDIHNHAATLIRVVEKRESEFGDAPEAALAYPSTCKIGAFPTCMSIGPAMWIRHASSGRLFFGPMLDLEADGNAGLCARPPCFPPYDQDECFKDGDAGLVIPPAYTIVGPVGSEKVVPCMASETGSLGMVCNTALWGADVDIHVTNQTPEEVYVNVLMDWNKSGEWSGSSMCPPCLGGAIAPEHVLVDFPVPPNFSGKLSTLMPVAKTFTIGPNPGYIWTRFTVTPNRMGNGWPGDGEFSDGETEDYLLHVKPAPVTHECDWNEGDEHKMHHAQLPDLDHTGVDVDMFWTPLADDFKCAESGNITDIHFWGSFADDCLPPGGPASLTFHVTIYSDIPAADSSTGYSMPGEPMWDRVFEPCTYTVRRMPDGPEDWYDPVTKLYSPQNHFQAYQYNICIDDDDVFHQEEGKIYWLEIKDIMDAGIEPDYTFGWKTTQIDLHWNDDAVYHAPPGGGWLELKYPPGHEYAEHTMDLAFVITGQGDPEPDIDWGDAPDPTYPTLAASLGASHAIVPNIFMGNMIDRDPDGQPTPLADGDDNDPDGDDEDGVTFDTPLIPGQMAQITVNASIGGPFISVWIDFDGDGGWGQAHDYVVKSVLANNPGPNVFQIPVPPGIAAGIQTFARIRFTTNPGIGFGGHATNGEVEDYLVDIEPGHEPKPPVPHLKWSQPPIEIDPVVGRMPTYCGWDQLSFSTKELGTEPAVWRVAADDFRCLGRMPITSVHWWGSYKNWLEHDPPAGIQPKSWRIAFWSNAPIDALHPYSRPEKLLHVIKVHPSEVEEVWVGMDMFPDPTIAPEACFQYYVQLKPEDYFWQHRFLEHEDDGTVRDTVFWISITAVYEGFPGPEHPWGWKTRPEHWMDDAVTFSLSQNDFEIGQVLDPDGITPLESNVVCDRNESYDLAFELDTEPNYIKWEQPFTGLRHWKHYEDEESMGIEKDGTPAKWEQLPDLYWPGLHCHDSVNGWKTKADDWRCDGGDVTDLHWYGNYEVDSHGQEKRGSGIRMFHISIHEPDPHDPCLPGIEIQGYDVPLAAASETYTGLLNREGCRIYRYEYYLPDPFPQIKGKDYWFDLSAHSVQPANPAIWRWQEAGRSPTPIEYGAVERSDPMPGVWRTIEWDRSHIKPPEPNWFSDMAFAVTSGPKEEVVEIQRLVADDWPCTTKEPIVAAVWWGSYLGYRYEACECPTAMRPVKPAYFLLSIWTDVPAGVDLPHSHPGEKIWEYKAYEHEYDEVLVGFDKHPEDVPGQHDFGREPVFRYSVRLGEENWFCQEKEDGVYWFSVVAVYKEQPDGTEPPYRWGWTNHEHVFNDDAVAGVLDSTGVADKWIWTELLDQTEEASVDMSFILFTDPNFCDDCADYNDDGIVNFVDYAYFADDWLWTGPACGYNDSDLNCDGVVDFKDLKILTEQWLAGCP
ncbi:MAG: hypothetical protein ISS79_03340 [Phycisphaerae bacterium]|nr:hypothetical protein [Phycisphaerae bacterium]